MDPFADAFANIGGDFETLFAPLLAPVTVESVDPDTAAARETAEEVPALKRSRRRWPVMMGGGGEIGGDQCRFVFRSSRVAAVLKYRDRITEADGSVWEIDERGATHIAMGSLWACDVTRKRS